jgi:hypothetical protein
VSILKDWANPFVREFIQIYPEITTTKSESLHADKFTKEINNQLTPMWANWKIAAHKHFYIHEIAQISGGRYVMPLRWVIFDKKEHAEVLFLSLNEVRSECISSQMIKEPNHRTRLASLLSMILKWPESHVRI